MSITTTIKIVFIGESNSGKSEIIKKYLKLEQISKPTVFDTYRYKYKEGEYKDIYLNICDTNGSEEIERLIKMSYLDADIFILCIESSNVKDNLHYQKVINDLKKSDKPILLAVTKCDKFIKKSQPTMYSITSSTNNNLSILKHNSYEIIKKYNLTSYMLVSNKRIKSIEELFDEVVKIYYEQQNMNTRHQCCCFYY